MPFLPFLPSFHFLNHSLLFSFFLPSFTHTLPFSSFLPSSFPSLTHFLLTLLPYFPLLLTHTHPSPPSFVHFCLNHSLLSLPSSFSLSFPFSYSFLLSVIHSLSSSSFLSFTHSLSLSLASFIFVISISPYWSCSATGFHFICNIPLLILLSLLSPPLSYYVHTLFIYPSYPFSYLGLIDTIFHTLICPPDLFIHFLHIFNFFLILAWVSLA